MSKVRKLRYDAALKFGAVRVEDEARGRLLAALALATLEPQDGKICLIIEDSLAKNWLQGQLKIHQQVFDHSFNSEIVRVSAQGLFTVLGSIFDRAELETFRTAYDTLQQTEDAARRARLFKGMVRSFAEGAASMAGEGVVAVVKAHLPG